MEGTALGETGNPAMGADANMFCAVNIPLENRGAIVLGCCRSILFPMSAKFILIGSLPAIRVV